MLIRFAADPDLGSGKCLRLLWGAWCEKKILFRWWIAGWREVLVWWVRKIPSSPFPSLYKNLNALIKYTKQLTLEAHRLINLDIEKLKAYGYDDGEILEVNQVVAYFNYANRTVLGLGVNTDNEVLGLSPKNKTDENSWDHQ